MRHSYPLGNISLMQGINGSLKWLEFSAPWEPLRGSDAGSQWGSPSTVFIFLTFLSANTLSFNNSFSFNSVDSKLIREPANQVKVNFSLTIYLTLLKRAIPTSANWICSKNGDPFYYYPQDLNQTRNGKVALISRRRAIRIQDGTEGTRTLLNSRNFNGIVKLRQRWAVCSVLNFIWW